MPLPDAICSDNCGIGDLVPEFIRAWTFVPLPFYGEYNRGKLFVYEGTEPDGRCVWFPTSPSGFWNFEKISRYPEGGNFPLFNEIPGKWSWRLSVDRFPFTDLPPIPPPYILNGWQANFDRHDDVDPDHKCVTSSAVFDYAHLGFFPPATIEPIVAPVQSPELKNTAGPCFCAKECPPTSRPYRKYLVRHDGVEVSPGYNLGKLYQIESVEVERCKWSPAFPDPATAIESLEKQPLLPLTGDHAYRMELQIRHLTAGVRVFEKDYEWDTGGTPLPRFPARCDQPFQLLAQTTSQIAEIIPVPEGVCTDEEAREFANRPFVPTGEPTQLSTIARENEIVEAIKEQLGLK